MDLSRRPCIVSVGVGNAYRFGVDRLERSLLHHGWAGCTKFWRDYPKDCPAHRGDDQYNFKLYAMIEAFEEGSEVVLWCDSSLYAIKDPTPIFDYIVDHGIYFFKSGYPLSATATDKLLGYAGEIREDLVEVPEFATGCVGIDLRHEVGRTFFTEWMRYMRDGMFGGSRFHNPADSKHPLFKFSRQDQSAASIVLHKMGIKEAGHEKEWVSYYPTETENTILFVKGI